MGLGLGCAATGRALIKARVRFRVRARVRVRVRSAPDGPGLCEDYGAPRQSRTPSPPCAAPRVRVRVSVRL